MNNRSAQSNDDSFPFMGLFAFLLIGAIIVGAMGLVFYQRGQGRTSSARSEISIFNDMLSIYIVDCDGPPTGAQGLTALIRNPGVTGWSGPYVTVKRGLRDPWGTPYRYVVLGGSPIVSSAGPDGAFGTPDDL